MRRLNIANLSFTYDDEDPEGFRAGMYRFGPQLEAEQAGARRGCGVSVRLLTVASTVFVVLAAGVAVAADPAPTRLVHGPVLFRLTGYQQLSPGSGRRYYRYIMVFKLSRNPASYPIRKDAGPARTPYGDYAVHGARVGLEDFLSPVATIHSSACSCCTPAARPETFRSLTASAPASASRSRCVRSIRCQEAVERLARPMRSRHACVARTCSYAAKPPAANSSASAATRRSHRQMTGSVADGITPTACV